MTRARAGFTLIEMLVVLGVVTLVGTLGVSALYDLATAQRRAGQGERVAIGLDRLAAQFRGEVRGAAGVEGEVPGPDRSFAALRVDLGEGTTVVYRVTPRGLQVERSRDGTVQARELFPAPEGRSFRLALADRDEVPVATIALAGPAPGSVAGALRIDVPVGRERRQRIEEARP